MSSVNAVNGINNLMETMITQQTDMVKKFVNVAVVSQVQGLGQDAFVPGGSETPLVTYGPNGLKSS
jgi:hypothetical protein